MPHRPAWRNAKHASQWENTLKTYADPVFGSMPVHTVNTSLVMKVIEPLWRGHLHQLLPARTKVRQVAHHVALPYADLPAFMEALRIEKGTAACALEFLILAAARTSEVIGADGMNSI